MGRSRKENERRLALHPRHLDRIPQDLREHIYLERGYGAPFGVSDDDLGSRVAGLLTHRELIDECDVVLQPKPLLSDVEELRAGQVLWGWPHCVQDAALTQRAVDEGLTLIAFEAMNHWNDDGSFGLHVFHKNNELAGYCSVLHALQLAGVTGDYGPKLRAVVIGFGATARGAVTALSAMGVNDVDVLTHRQVAAVASPIHSVRMIHFDSDDSSTRVSHAVTPPRAGAAGRFLGRARHHRQLRAAGHRRAPRLPDRGRPDVADVPHDRRRRLLRRGHGVLVGPADDLRRADVRRRHGRHVLRRRPQSSHLWRSATWENSEALLPFIRTVLGGPEAWDAHPTIRRAVEIREGVIQNPAILRFQGRAPAHPHRLVSA